MRIINIGILNSSEHKLRAQKSSYNQIYSLGFLKVFHKFLKIYEYLKY